MWINWSFPAGLRSDKQALKHLIRLAFILHVYNNVLQHYQAQHYHRLAVAPLLSLQIAMGHRISSYLRAFLMDLPRHPYQAQRA